MNPQQSRHKDKILQTRCIMEAGFPSIKRPIAHHKVQDRHGSYHPRETCWDTGISDLGPVVCANVTGTEAVRTLQAEYKIKLTRSFGSTTAWIHMFAKDGHSAHGHSECMELCKNHESHLIYSMPHHQQRRKNPIKPTPSRSLNTKCWQSPGQENNTKTGGNTWCDSRRAYKLIEILHH